MQIFRICKKCGTQKKLEEFSKSNQCKNGRRYECVECRNKRCRKIGPRKPSSTWFKKGHTPSESSIKTRFTKERLIGNKFNKGRIPHNFIDGKGIERAKKLRSKINASRIKKLRIKIFERDGFKCTSCMKHNEILHMHHKIPLRIDLSKAYDEENLVTLCPKCHATEEKKYRNLNG